MIQKLCDWGYKNMSEHLIQSFEMLGQGMMGIFVVLGLIALLVVLMQKISGKK